MGSIVGTAELQRLFAASFVAMLVAVPVYSALVARLPRRWLVRVVYHFFALCLLGFWGLTHFESPTVQLWVARVLFVWISVYGLFATSVFWSVLADLFSSDQGKRLFGMIAAGGTAGAIVGSFIASQLAARVSTDVLLLPPILMLEAGLWCAWRIERQANLLGGNENAAAPRDKSGKPTGGSLLTGIVHVAKSPYLASICLFLFLVQACGTQLYFEQAEIVRAEMPSEQSRTQLFAYLDLGTQLLTLLVQVGLSGWILRRLGVSVALVFLPAVYLIGFAVLAWHQSLEVLAVTVIFARAGGYGITVPAREVLFTVVSREDKYKSKSFIDTVVLRGGDAVSGQVFGTLRASGFSLTAMNVMALPIIGIWGLVAWRLGQRQRQRALSPDSLAMPIPAEHQGNQ